MKFIDRIQRMHIPSENFDIYCAGLPGYPSNFSRDSLLSGMIARDSAFLKQQLEFSAIRQGQKKDPYSGEEVGKIFHEFPRVELDGLSTEFNACDTTALFLLAHEHYLSITGDQSLSINQKDAIIRAANYILDHLVNGVFVESPIFSGADRYALKVTYWKDSQVPRREAGEPQYPVKYLLVQAQNLAGIRSAAKLLGSKELEKVAQNMLRGLWSFYNLNHTFTLFSDTEGSLKGHNSDVLHMLFYLNPGDLNSDMIETVRYCAESLETPIGFKTLQNNLSQEVADNGYHSRSIWPFEQALIHVGAQKFELPEIASVAERIFPHLDTDPEIFMIQGDGNFRKGGCDPQLWTIAAKHYFGTYFQQLHRSHKEHSHQFNQVLANAATSKVS